MSCLPNCTEHNNFTLISRKSLIIAYDYDVLTCAMHASSFSFPAAEEALPELPYPCSYRGKQLVDRESGVYLVSFWSHGFCVFQAAGVSMTI